MLTLNFTNFTLPHWHTLTVALIGVGSASLALLVGAVLVGRRRHHHQSLPSQAKPQSNRDPFVHGSATEKRISLRRRGNSVKVELAGVDGVVEPEDAWVVDRSMGGLCLRAEHRLFELGTILNVRPANTPRGVPWSQVEVKSCRAQGRGWELGCQFLKTPPWSLLLLFG